MKKIYCFSNGGPPEWLQAVALGEDGHVLATHICSHVGFMEHDLGTWKHELYDKHFGLGNWELEWVEDPATHKGVIAANILHKSLYAQT